MIGDYDKMMEPRNAVADFETISLAENEHKDGVATVILDRPEARNAMNDQLRTELKETLSAIADSDVHVVVLTGSEESSTFVSGADVKDLRDRSSLEQRRLSNRRRVYDAVEDLPQPVIARINGHAFGGGLELALACDVRIATSDLKFGFPEVSLGLIPGGGGTQRLPRLVGEGQAKRLILSGEVIDAIEAHEIGVLEVLAGEDSLDEEVYSLAEKIANHSPVAVEFAKDAVSASSQLPLNDGIEYETQLFCQLFGTEDKNEGIDAFLEDRDPEWSGR